MTGRLAEIEARVNRATEGPWETRRDGALVTVADWQGTVGRFHRGGGVADAEFVAHAREDVPYLLARVRELEAALRISYPTTPVDCLLSTLSELESFVYENAPRELILTHVHNAVTEARAALAAPVPAEKEER